MFILYKIYYKDSNNNDILVYLGKTTQKLNSRLHNHFFKDKKSKVLDLNLVSKIEYCTCESQADLNLYEVYFIEFFKPLLNKDVKSKDKLTVELPSLQWNLFVTYLLEKWKSELNLRNLTEKEKQDSDNRIINVFKETYNKNQKEMNPNEFNKWFELTKNNNSIGYNLWNKSINKN